MLLPEKLSAYTVSVRFLMRAVNRVLLSIV
mgnify:CR=1 FL=1